MSFPLPNNVLQLPDAATKQILTKVFARQNAGIAKTMKKMGYNYPINYGVTIPLLRDIAGSFKPDHALAVQLRNHSDIREALILSSMLDEPEKITEQKALSICQHITTIEMVEQFSRNLLAKIPNLIELIKTIIKEDRLCASLCFMTFGWAIKFNNEQSTESINYIIELLKKESFIENPQITQSIKFAMQVIYDSGEEFQQNISTIADGFLKSDNKAVSALGHDFLWLNTQ